MPIGVSLADRFMRCEARRTRTELKLMKACVRLDALALHRFIHRDSKARDDLVQFPRLKAAEADCVPEGAAGVAVRFVRPIGPKCSPASRRCQQDRERNAKDTVPDSEGVVA